MHTLAQIRPVHFPGSFHAVFPEATTVKTVLGHIKDLMKSGVSVPVEFSVSNMVNGHLKPLSDSQRGFSENDAVGDWEDDEDNAPSGSPFNNFTAQGWGDARKLPLRTRTPGADLALQPKPADPAVRHGDSAARIVRFPGRAPLRLVRTDRPDDESA